MRRKSSRSAIALGALSVLSASSAFAVHFVSAAHGHGLASPDRLAIWLLGLLAAVSALASIWLVTRRA
jgi:hypothetical protein